MDLHRFLHVHKGNTAAAMKQVGATLEWREGYRWNSLLDEDFSDVLAVGKLTIHGFDMDGNPIAIWKQARHRPDDFGLERDMRFMIYCIEKAKKEGLFKEKMTMIIDRIGMTNHNFDSPLMKTLLSTLQAHYPEHLARLFVFPKNMLLSVGWNVAKVFLDAETIDRVKILTEDEHKNCLQQYITKENLFKRFGGIVDDPVDIEPHHGSPDRFSHDASDLEFTPPAGSKPIAISPRTSSNTTPNAHGHHHGKKGNLRLFGSTSGSHPPPRTSSSEHPTATTPNPKSKPPPPRTSSAVANASETSAATPVSMRSSTTADASKEDEGEDEFHEAEEGVAVEGENSLRASTVATLTSTPALNVVPGKVGTRDDGSVGDSAVSV
ncbi:hypothetical protein HDU97_009819 [Phlyctochytrium planicorne]|nr:hypothetical protein HDU97_009819 [Phlyctochytrium planicorne]